MKPSCPSCKKKDAILVRDEYVKLFPGSRALLAAKELGFCRFCNATYRFDGALLGKKGQMVRYTGEPINVDWDEVKYRVRTGHIGRLTEDDHNAKKTVQVRFTGINEDIPIPAGKLEQCESPFKVYEGGRNKPLSRQTVMENL